MNRKMERKHRLIESCLKAIELEEEHNYDIFLRERPFLEDKSIEEPKIIPLDWEREESEKKLNRLYEILTSLLHSGENEIIDQKKIQEQIAMESFAPTEADEIDF